MPAVVIQIYSHRNCLVDSEILDAGRLEYARAMGQRYLKKHYLVRFKKARLDNYEYWSCISEDDIDAFNKYNPKTPIRKLPPLANGQPRRYTNLGKNESC